MQNDKDTIETLETFTAIVVIAVAYWSFGFILGLL